MNPPENRVGVLPMGHIPELAVKIISAQFVAHFNIPAEILAPWPLPLYAFDPKRCQYDAAKILKALESEDKNPVFSHFEKVLCVLDVDIFVPVFTHVFGEARLGGKFGIVSLFRLENIPERMAKIALHEFGHLCRLEHCNEARCLMHFPGDIEELDRMPLYLCRYCLRNINIRTLSP